MNEKYQMNTNDMSTHFSLFTYNNLMLILLVLNWAPLTSIGESKSKNAKKNIAELLIDENHSNKDGKSTTNSQVNSTAGSD